MSDRELDVVILGATGITGRYVADYLAKRAGETGTSWAAAARNPGKLDRVLSEIGVKAPESIAADVGDPASLAAMASRARVVLNGVGPYVRYARPVIEACVAAGTHYVDLTGEIPFVREIIREFHDRAVASGVKVVQAAGFESLPPDLGVRLAAEAARDRSGQELAEVELRVTLTERPAGIRASDGMSGGTMQSAAAMVDYEHAASITDPAALVFDDAKADLIRRLSPISTRPRTIGGAVVAPMVPAAFINPAIIHRTAWLHGGEPFRYREGAVFDGRAVSFPLRYALAGAISGFQTGLARLTRARPSVRRRAARALTRMFPASGYGPQPERLEQWRWRMAIDARTREGQRVEVHIDGEGHPGYLATSKMLGEAGLLLAAAGATTERAGCLTPAVALGTACLDRFAHAGLHIRLLGV